MDGADSDRGLVIVPAGAARGKLIVSRPSFLTG